MSDAEQQSEYPKKDSKSSGGDTGWTIEAKIADYGQPFEMDGFVFSHKWQTIPIGFLPQEGVQGAVPQERSYGGVLEHYGMLQYAVAQALRWILHAKFKALTHGRSTLETKLVKHKLTYAFTSTPVSEHQHIHGGDRSDILPDWNAKPAPQEDFKDFTIPLDRTGRGNINADNLVKAANIEGSAQ